MFSRHPNSKSPPFQRHRRSLSEDSMALLNENIPRSDRNENYDRSAYVKMQKDAEKERKKRQEEVQHLVSGLQKNALHAKERRQNKPIPSLTPLDDENKLIPGIRHRTKDTVKVTTLEENPLSGQQTESAIFGSITTVVQPDKDRHAADEEEFQNRRRASSLHKLLESKYIDSAVPVNIHPCRQPNTEVKKPEEPPVLGISNDAKPSRPSNLDLGSNRERSGSDVSIVRQSLKDQDASIRRSSLGKLNLSFFDDTPTPITPDKRSSGFCEDDDFSQSEVTEKDTGKEKTKLSDDLSSSDSYPNQQSRIASSLGSFNPREEYDKIAKQLSEEEDSNHKNCKMRPASENSSVMSNDSGFRNSFDAPSIKEEQMEVWNSFMEQSSGEEEANLETPRKKPLTSETSAASVSSVSTCESLIDE